MANCYWITGLSASGKTTLSRGLASHLRTQGAATVLLDGDELRRAFDEAAYTRNERVALGYRYAALCQLLVEQGITVVIAVIGLFRELHDWNRAHIPGYVEIFLDVPIEELKRRDPKGLYSRAEKGQITHVAGIDLPVDFPAAPDIHFKWNSVQAQDEWLQVLIDEIEGEIPQSIAR